MKSKLLASIIACLTIMSTTAHASEVGTRAIIGDSVIINKVDKEESNSGNSALLPSDTLPTIPSTGGNSEVKEYKGSLTISLEEINGDIKLSQGVSFGICKVADIENGEYKLLKRFENSGVNLNELETSSDLEIASNMLMLNAEADKVVSTDVYGTVKFTDLEVGVYLVFAKDTSNYDNITPFIVSNPIWDEESKSMVYDIHAIPKHTPKPVPEPAPVKNEENKEGVSKAPATNYDSKALLYGGISVSFLISGLSLLILSRRNRGKR